MQQLAGVNPCVIPASRTLSMTIIPEALVTSCMLQDMKDDLYAAHLIRSCFTLYRAGIRAEVQWPQRRVSCHRGRVLFPGNRGRYGAPNDSKRHPLQELSRPLASGRKLNALASALARDMFRNRHSLRPAPWSDTAPQIDLSLRLADFLHQFPAPGCRLRSQDGSSGETAPG